MNCSNVPSILKSEPSRTACERLAAAKPDCECERCSVRPKNSPGPVSAAETLARFVPPHDFDAESNCVKPSLFSHAGTNGMSVTRVEHAGEAAMRHQQQSKNYLGYVDVKCAAIQEILHDDKRSFCIYDTALPDNAAHADVCQTVFKPASVRSELRRQLMLAFSKDVKSATS